MAAYSNHILTRAHCRTPEDPKHPDHPVTSQIKKRQKGRRRMVKKRQINNEGGGKQILEWSPLRHSLSQNRTTLRLSSRTETLQRNGGANTLFGLLEHAAIT